MSRLDPLAINPALQSAFARYHGCLDSLTQSLTVHRKTVPAETIPHTYTPPLNQLDASWRVIEQDFWCTDINGRWNLLLQDPIWMALGMAEVTGLTREEVTAHQEDAITEAGNLLLNSATCEFANQLKQEFTTTTVKLRAVGQGVSLLEREQMALTNMIQETVFEEDSGEIAGRIISFVQFVLP